MTSINDVVLIYIEETPFTFARIEDINPDHKKGWYHVSMLFLQIPLQSVTWLIRETYLDGEAFTMNGKKVRLEKIENKTPGAENYSDPDDDASDSEKKNGNPPKTNAKVIPFSSIKKNEP
jgi:hypothetical protein